MSTENNVAVFFTLDELLSDTDYYNLDENSEAAKSIWDALMDRLASGTNETLSSQGWSLKEKAILTRPGKFQSEKLYLIFSGTGSLHGLDTAMKALSATLSCDLSALDYNNELVQGYCNGDYDTGSISEGDDHYGPWAAEVRDWLNSR